MRRLAVALLVMALAAVAAAPAATAAGPSTRQAASPKPSLTVLTGTEKTLRSRGRLRVRVRYGALGRVRVMVRVRGGSKRWGTRLMKARLLSFRRPGRRTVALSLTRFGRSLLRRRARGCAAQLRFVVLARARRYRRLPGRPLFSPLAKSRGSKWAKRVRRLTRPRCPKKAPAKAGGPAAQGGAAAGQAPMRAGAAAADITPPVGTPMFAYTARSGLANPPLALQIVGDPDENLYAKTFVPSEGIHTRVRARAIVIERDGRKFAMVQTDLGGLPYALTQEVLKRVAATGITADHLMLSATHTHSSTGPIWPLDSNGYALLGGDAFDPRVFDLTAEGIAEAIRTANDRLEPAKLGVGSSQIADASRNREFETFRLNPDVPADEAGARAVQVDPTVTVVRVDASDGRPLGVWSNFAVHPTSFGDDNLLLSGDNAASAERVAEAEISQDAGAAGHAPSADRPVVNVWTNATEGDVSPNGGPDKDGADDLQYVPNAFAAANMTGMRTGRGIAAAWRDAGAHMDSAPVVDSRRTIATMDGSPFDGEEVGPLPVLGGGGITLPDNTCSPVPNPQPGQGKKFTQATGPLVPDTAPVSVWQIGSVGILALPTEMTTQQGRRIRTVLTTQAGGRVSGFIVAGLTNGYLSYTATPEEYDGCTYEGSFTLFGRQQGPFYRETGKSVLAALLAGTNPASSGEPLPTSFTVSPDTTDTTADAGTVTQEPADVKRFERAVFKWKAGDPSVDAKRGQTFVAMQREVSPGDWQTVGTDDGYRDTTRYDDSDKTWTDTWQFAECDPLGTYRFHVTGVAKTDSADPHPYTRDSQPFTLAKTDPLTFDTPTVSGGTATFAARYPDPGPDILTALPRRVRTGTAKVTVDGTPVDAELDSDKLHFTAPASDGATVVVTDVDDGCGNTAP